jgi:hypothetical protein
MDSAFHPLADAGRTKVKTLLALGKLDHSKHALSSAYRDEVLRATFADHQDNEHVKQSYRKVMANSTSREIVGNYVCIFLYACVLPSTVRQ